MKIKNNLGKTLVAITIVLIFLISSIAPINASITDSGIIGEDKPLLNNIEPELDTTSNNELNIEYSTNSEELQYQHQTPQKKYAVIMVGQYYGLWKWYYLLNLTVFLDIVQQYYTWYLNDAGKLYSTLYNTYGYDHDHIFLLVKLLPDYFVIPDTFNPDWIDYVSSKENLETVMDTFIPGGENELTEQDQLFFCYIDHGANEEVNYYGNDHYTNEFISPDIHTDTNWIDELKAYDFYTQMGHYVYHDTGTYAVFKQPQNGWSDQLVLKLNTPKNIKGFRISAKSYKDSQGNQLYLDQMKIWLYNGAACVNTTTFTSWSDGTYEYIEFEGEEKVVDKVVIKFHENDPYWGFAVRKALVYDFNFWESDSCGEVGSRTYFGCPFLSIPDVLLWIFGFGEIEKIYDFELMFDTWNINAKIIFALQPCMSGGFVSELSGENRIVCTASRGFELANAGWIGPFVRALNRVDENADGLPDADYNGDNKVSILEAYKYAAISVEEQLNNDPMIPPQHPLIDDNGDDIGHHFCETNYYDPDDPSKDGYLANQTFLGEIGNFPPDKPDLTGQISGETGETYLFHFKTTDPNGDNVYYFLDWGDTTNTGWIGPYPSGEERWATHSWSQEGTYTVKVKAKDTYDVESDWTILDAAISLNQEQQIIQQDKLLNKI